MQEDALANFPIDFKFDLSACCTRPNGYPTCLQDLSPIYDFFLEAEVDSVRKKALMDLVFAGLVAHAKPLLLKARLGPQARLLIRLCGMCGDGSCANLKGDCTSQPT